jgi:glycosyltransferase involved in cell wall biosynthesis
LRLISVQTTNERGGGEYASVDLLEGLAARGAAVKLLTNLPDLVTGTNVPVRAIDLGPKLARATALKVALGFLPNLRRLARALAEESSAAPIDVLLLHYKKEQLMGAVLPPRLAPAIVWAEWGPLPHALRRGPGKLLYRLAARRTRRVLAASEATKGSLVAAGIPAERIVVVPPLLDASAVRFDPRAREEYRREWGLSEDTFVIGCVGRFHRKKRTELVISALEHLPPDAVLVLAGEGGHEPVLRAHAARFGDRVRFLATPRGRVGELLSACDVAVVAPSREEGEPPRAVAFGQLAGRPVIATGLDSAAEFVVPGTGAVVRPPDDARALASCLSEYRADPARRMREGEAARRHACQRFDRRRVIGDIELLLSDAISEAAARRRAS